MFAGGLLHVRRCDGGLFQQRKLPQRLVPYRPEDGGRRGDPDRNGSETAARTGTGDDCAKVSSGHPSSGSLRPLSGRVSEMRSLCHAEYRRCAARMHRRNSAGASPCERGCRTGALRGVSRSALFPAPGVGAGRNHHRDFRSDAAASGCVVAGDRTGQTWNPAAEGRCRSGVPAPGRSGAGMDAGRDADSSCAEGRFESGRLARRRVVRSV